MSAKRDKDSDLTIFFSRKAFDPQGAKTSAPWTFGVHGYTRAERGFCVVADDRLDFTIEHEEGHFLGALDASGKFVSDFGHSSGSNIMNVSGTSNGYPGKHGDRLQQGLCRETLSALSCAGVPVPDRRSGATKPRYRHHEAALTPTSIASTRKLGVPR